ncbi:hypothetical protein [Tamlana crocina]|uniref:Uncharacterized protein n=1 Tax=Tamlana crocina TaxID=393006 RepID=A0ABX1DEX7_9FLAO|nr:hypothetical protein [Tamlana crocina]NJX16885.1 hypothetical protein [Tamlana crocina]
MKINNQNIYGGNQQFADLIINSKDNKIDELDRKFLKLVYENTSSPEEREELIKSLSDIKENGTNKESIQKSRNILSNFLKVIPGEAGKQIVKELIENGSEYLTGLI